MRKFLLIFLPLVALLLMASIIRGVQQQGLTAGGPTQDFQHGSFSAAQPVKAGMFFLAPSTTLGANLDHARMSIGFTDGTNHRCVSVRSRDAQGVNSDTVRQAFTNQLAWIYAASTTNAAGAMGFSSMANDKIVGTYGTLFSAAWYVNALLFGGSDVEACVGDFALNTSDGGTTVVSSSTNSTFTFGWDLIFFISRIASFNGTSTTHALLSFGVAIWDGSAISQGCVSWSNQNGVGTEVSSAELNDQRCAHGHVMPSADGDECEITARNSSGGFTATTRGTQASGYSIGFLALRLGGIQGIKLFSRDTPAGGTPPVSDSWTDAGHSPQFMLSMSSSATAMNTLSSGAADAVMSIGAACGDSGSHEEFSSAIMADDGAATSDTKCVTHNVFHHSPDQAGATPVTADLTSIQVNGATLNYSAVQTAARKQLILSVGRSSIFGAARDAAGAVEKSAGKSSHAGRGASAPGAAEKAPGKAQHSAQAKVAAGALDQAAPSLTAGGTAHAGRGASAPGALGKAAGTSQHLGQAKISASALERGVATSQHGGQARSAAGAAERAIGASTHLGSAKADAGGTTSAAGTAQHGGRASTSARVAEKAAGLSAHAGRAMTTAAASDKASGVSSHAARATAAAGALDKAAPIKQAAGVSYGRASGAPGALGKASAASRHGARAASAGGSQEKASGASSKLGRATGVAGAQDLAPGKVAHLAQAKDASGERAEARGRMTAGGRSVGDPQAGALGSGKATVSHGGRAQTAAGDVSMGAGKSTHMARARTTAGESANVGFTPAEALGFYARTSRAVRSRLIAVAGALQIQHENLRFTEPAGIWAKASIDFDEINDVEYGSGNASYLVPGTLEIELRTKLREGKKALLEQAELLATELQIREIANVVYAAAALRPARDAGDDEFSAKLSIPFRSWDSSYSRVAGALPAGDDYTDAERAVRSRFATELPDVAVSYDNLPPTTGATWVRLAVNEQEGFDAGGVRRTVGMMEAEIHAPAHSGTKASLKLADRIVEAFRTVDVGGVVFEIPYLTRGRQRAGEWITQVFCPWSVDHA